jgi:hypothetical protein
MGGEAMNRLVLLVCAALIAAGLLSACGGRDNESGSPSGSPVNAADFQAKIDNPLFPLSSLRPKVFEGEEKDPDTGNTVKTRLESTVLPGTDVLAGVNVVVLEEKAYKDGVLIEAALDYFAQHRDGSVYYFGERVDNYENGKVANHDGQWLTGEGESGPGVVMPAKPVAGQVSDQEHAPGVAEDKSKVVALDLAVTTPAASFKGCLKTDDYTLLDSPVVHEFKFFCPGVGLVHEDVPDGHLDLISY